MELRRSQTISRGHRLAYLAAGEGDPLLLVNGLGAPAQAWVDAGYVTELAQTRRVLAIDTLGHAESDKPQEIEQYPEPEVALDLLAVLDTEEISEPVDVWGYSRGGRLSLMLALEAPERLRSVVAGGCTVGASPEVQSNFAAALAAPLLEGSWEQYWEMVPMPREQQRVVEKTINPRVAGAILQALARAPYSFDLNQLEVPLLLYVGERDVFAPLAVEDAKEAHTALCTLPGLDHGEAFAHSQPVLQRVRDFWTLAGI